MPEQLKRNAQEDIRKFFCAGFEKKKKNQQPEEESPEPDCSTLEFLQLIPEDWKEFLAGVCAKPFFKRLEAFVTKESLNHVVYPPRDEIFAALSHCPLNSLKVVIIGQDPYHGPSQAHGLCFSVRKGVRVPPSLVNIYKEAGTDVNMKRPTHGCLTSWSSQGVLLLNTVLTVRKGVANSHQKKGWEEFTDSIIHLINSKLENVVFLLWGAPAGKKAEFINKKKHCVLQSSHPSPLGATKTKAPFIGSKCFSKANEYLKEHDKNPINWQIEE